jgi:hypothetical protein
VSGWLRGTSAIYWEWARKLFAGQIGTKIPLARGSHKQRRAPRPLNFGDTPRFVGMETPLGLWD